MKIRVMIKEPYKAPYEAEIDNELAEFQRIVAVGEWNTIDVHIQLDNSKGQYVEYEGTYGA